VAVAAYTVIEKLSQTIGDPIVYSAGVLQTDGVRVLETDWLSFLNRAAKQIVLIRPDVNSAVESIQLVAGTKQAIPAGSHRLLDVIRNMGTDGTIPGKAITLVSKQDLDLINSEWHNEDDSDEIYHFVFDSTTPKVFYVMPPVDSTITLFVEIAHSKIPTEMTSSADNLPLSDLYLNPMMDWALYLAYNLDTDSPGNTAMAIHYYKSFYQSLGIALEVETAVAPGV